MPWLSGFQSIGVTKEWRLGEDGGAGALVGFRDQVFQRGFEAEQYLRIGIAELEDQLGAAGDVAADAGIQYTCGLCNR
jgi:hypothetical protein